MYIALALFAITYILMLVFSKFRPYIALASGLIFIVCGMLPLNSVFGAIDFNVLLMIAGTMGIVALFIVFFELVFEIVVEAIGALYVALMTAIVPDHQFSPKLRKRIKN